MRSQCPDLQTVYCNYISCLQAYINVPAEDQAGPPAKGSSDRAVMERLSISLNPKTFANRIQLIKSLDQLRDVRPFSQNDTLPHRASHKSVP